MKKLILSIQILISFNISYSQTAQFEKPRYLKYATLLCPINITKSYSEEGLIESNKATISEKKIEGFEIKKDNSDNNVVVTKMLTDTLLNKNILIAKGNAFNVIQQIGSFSIIKFWDLGESHAQGLLKKITSSTIGKSKSVNELPLGKGFDSLKVNGLAAVMDTTAYDLSKSYFIVSTQTIINSSTEFENKSGLWNIGLLVLPIKIRPFASESGQFDFSNGFSVGTTFAWTVHHNWKTNFTHNFLLYAGISSYKADSSKIKERREDYTIATFSPAIGWMWEKNNVQLSILMGIDFPTGNLQKSWVYRNQPWFGLGVGIALFKINNDTQTKNGTN